MSMIRYRIALGVGTYIIQYSYKENKVFSPYFQKLNLNYSMYLFSLVCYCYYFIRYIDLYCQTYLGSQY